MFQTNKERIWVINELKTSAEEKVKAIQDALENKEEAKGIYGDTTRPGRSNEHWFAPPQFLL